MIRLPPALLGRLVPGQLRRRRLDGVDDLPCGGVDHAQRGFQLRQLLSPAPPGHIAQGVVRSVNAEVLADDIGHALRLHLLLPPGLGKLRKKIRGMELGMGGLMDQRFDGLRLAHAGPDHHPVFREAGVTLRRSGDRAQLHGEGAQGGEAGIDILKVWNVPAQIGDEAGQLPALRLAHVKHGGDPETGGVLPPFLLQRFAVRPVQGSPGGWVLFLIFHKIGKMAGGKDLDALLVQLDLPSEFLLPVVVPGHAGGGRALQQDQQRVSKAVMMKLGHGGDVLRIAPAGVQLLTACSITIDSRRVLCCS